MSEFARILSITKAKKTGGHNCYIGICPCHNDTKPSLSIKFLPDRENPLVYCFAGCSFSQLRDYFQSIGLWRESKGKKYVFR